MDKKVSIKKSKLENSPIVVDSFNKNASPISSNKKSLFENPYVRGIIIAVIAVLILPNLPFNKQNMSEDSSILSKVNIEDSELTNSPIVVDSPNTNINLDIPQPEMEISPITTNIPKNNIFKSEFRLKINSKVPIQSFYLRASDPNIIDMHIRPLDGRATSFGGAGKKDGYVFNTIHNANGEYELIIETTEKENIRFGINIQ